MRSLACLLFVAYLARPAAGADLPEILERGRLRVAAVQAGPSAFDRELLEGFARLRGLRIELISVRSWEEQVPALLRDEADLVLGLVDTERLRKQIALTGEILPARSVVITVRPRRIIQSVEELRVARVGVVRGTAWAQAVLEAGVPPDQVEPYPDIETTFAALRAREIDAVVASLSDYAVVARRLPDYETGLVLGSPGRVTWGTRRADATLHTALDQYLTNVRRTSTWSRLLVEHFGEKALAVLGRQ